MSEQSEFRVDRLLRTATVGMQAVHCTGTCRHRSAEECSSHTHVVYPYRGVFVRHVGSDDAVAESNQVLFFNQGQGYSVSHPVTGGDSCFVLAADEQLLRELTPKERLDDGAALRFRMQRLTLDTRALALAALLRHSLYTGVIEDFEAESLALTLLRRTLGPRTSREPRGSRGHAKLVNRTKVALSTDLSRRWTLAEIAKEVGVSPVYLTQVFQQVEGVPLYRYQLRLRLARALDLIDKIDDLSELALELGFSNHSHFSSAFRQAFGRSPTAFKEAVR